MPVTPTYPGVYVEELPSGVRTITGVSTSITAFIGLAKQGPTDRAVRIQSVSDFERSFGGLWVESPLGYMVQQFFLNGGADALVIRVVADDAVEATVAINGLSLIAASEGDWMNDIIVEIDHATRDPDPDDTLFNLTILQEIPNSAPVALEKFRNLSTKQTAPRFVTKVLAQESSLVRIQRVSDTDSGVPQGKPGAGPGSFAGGDNGGTPTYAEYNGSPGRPTIGLRTLDRVDIFNLLCIAPRFPDASVADDPAGVTLLTEALQLCVNERAMLIVDPPTSWDDPTGVEQDSANIRTLLRSKNAAVYYPNIIAPDPLRENRLESFPPSGAMAGVMARTDSQRGVWKAPAGTEATLSGARGFTYKLNDGENGRLNPLGVNCLRTFPVYGNVAWGARTLDGADQLASEWKYIPVRRLALFLEESLYRGTQWVVFEPNDEPLWAQIRLNIGAFMNSLFKQGAFQGSSSRDAYFVKCDSETTTQNDIDRGIVNIIIGYAPLKPAEFVILKFQQIAGQLET
ncbi:MAG: phage tail sheath C-terminal domain-containing protein [Elainellaceae cyanobacterium]